MAHRPCMARMVGLDSLVVWSVGVLVRGIRWVVVEHGHATRRSGGPAIEAGGRPLLVARIVHALGGAAVGTDVRGLGGRARAWRNVAEKRIQEGLVRERVFRCGLYVDEITKVLLEILITICHLATMCDSREWTGQGGSGRWVIHTAVWLM